MQAAVAAKSPPALKIWVLIAGIAAAAASLTLWVSHISPLVAPVQLAWPLMVPLVFLGEVAIVSLRFRRDAHVFSMSEVPLVIGLFLADPLGLIAAQFIGNGLALGWKRRQTSKKLLFNLSMLTLQASLAVIVFRAALGDGDPLGRGSLGALAAIALGVVAANVLINTAIVLSGGGLNRKERVSTFLLGLGSAGMNASLGLVAVTVVWTQPATLWAAAVPPVALYLAYRAYVSQREERQRVQVLYEATNAIFGSARVEEVLRMAAQHARSMFDADRAEIQIVGTSGALRAVDGSEEPNSVDDSPDLWDEILDGGRTSLLSCTDPRHGSNDRLHRMVVPLEGADGFRGAILIGEPMTPERNYGQRDLKLLETLASQVSLSLENGRLEDSVEELTRIKEDLHYQARHDPLTGLGNRGLLWEALVAAATQAEPAAVLLLDLDDFKSVNDMYGHQAGDDLLIEIARRLQACCRPEDTVARLGGDEFAILLARMASSDDATIVASRIAQALSHPADIGEALVTPQASMGIALIDPSLSPEEMIQRADKAMYTAKSAQKGTYSVYPDHQYRAQRPGSSLRADLTRAVEREEFVLAYQPIVDLVGRRVTGVEALVRWQHPQRGLLYPDMFIPLAEETGVIVDLGRWVLAEACRQMSLWHGRLGGHTPSISVNLSPRELSEVDVVEGVAKVLAMSGLDGRHLTVEITENMMMQPFSRVLDELKDLNVKIAMDDFGVGYSSLSYLDRLPIDIVKIDRTFVAGLTADKESPLVNLIIQIGDALGLDTVAEGVESDDQLSRLLELGCRSGQGYLFARPMDATALWPFLQAGGGPTP